MKKRCSALSNISDPLPVEIHKKSVELNLRFLTQEDYTIFKLFGNSYSSNLKFKMLKSDVYSKAYFSVFIVVNRTLPCIC